MRLFCVSVTVRPGNGSVFFFPSSTLICLTDKFNQFQFMYLSCHSLWSIKEELGRLRKPRKGLSPIPVWKISSGLRSRRLHGKGSGVPLSRTADSLAHTTFLSLVWGFPALSIVTISSMCCAVFLTTPPTHLWNQTNSSRAAEIQWYTKQALSLPPGCLPWVPSHQLGQQRHHLDSSKLVSLTGFVQLNAHS